MRAKLLYHGRSHAAGGSDPIPGIGNIHRVVYGAVLNDGGTVDAGSGDWSVEWSQSGSGAPGYPAPNIYTFTVPPAFSSTIANVLVQADYNGHGNDPYLAIVDTDAGDVSTFVVKTFSFIGD